MSNVLNTLQIRTPYERDPTRFRMPPARPPSKPPLRFNQRDLNYGVGDTVVCTLDSKIKGRVVCIDPKTGSVTISGHRRTFSHSVLQKVA